MHTRACSICSTQGEPQKASVARVGLSTVRYQALTFTNTKLPLPLSDNEILSLNGKPQVLLLPVSIEYLKMCYLKNGMV